MITDGFAGLASPGEFRSTITIAVNPRATTDIAVVNTVHGNASGHTQPPRRIVKEISKRCLTRQTRNKKVIQA